MKKIGLALLVATAAPGAFATGTYTEVWNPPEARTTVSRHIKATHKIASHRRELPHALKVRVQHVPVPKSSFATKQPHMVEVAPANDPDTMDIPRQITPEGNVLRVTARGTSVEVSR